MLGLKEVSYGVAFIAGLVSFVSPCLLPMIPAYIMYITGTSNEDEVKEKRRLAIMRTIAFILGFTIIFVIMGTTATSIGKAFAINKKLFTNISGTLIILFGLYMLGIIKLKVLGIEKKAKAPKKVTSLGGAMIMGIAFAAGWTPCFGPILASILMYASNSTTVQQGIMLLLVYSLGMAVPFLLTAIFINEFNWLLSKTGKLTKYTPQISGAIMILFGILIITNKLGEISKLLM